MNNNLDYKKLFESLPGPHLVIGADDPRFTILYENEEHAEIGLTSIDKAVGQPFFDIFPDNTETFKTTGVSDLAESLRTVIKTGEPDTMPLLHYDLPDKNGNLVERWWRATHYPILDDDNNVAYIYQSTKDITEEIKAKQRLELTQGQLDSALEVGLVSTWYWDVNSDVVIGDKNLAQHFGISPKAAAEGLPLQVFLDSITEADRPRVVAAIKDTAETGANYEQEYQTRDKAGNLYSVIARGKRFESEQLTYLAGTLIDVTQRKKAENENIRLRKLNEVKDEFVSLASHQLRTPATSVKQYLGIVLDEYSGPLTKAQAEYIEIANNANNRQLEIIEDLLKTAQIDTENYTLNHQRIDLNLLVYEVIEQYTPTVNGRNQTICSSLSKKAALITADRNELSICIANLLENASKYSPDKTTIKIATIVDKTHVCLRISDTGVGINPEDVSHIFNKFTRVDNALSDTVSGNGLGLYWVKRIVDLHKGTISVDSTPGKGSTFTIKLPV